MAGNPLVEIDGDVRIVRSWKDQTLAVPDCQSTEGVECRAELAFGERLFCGQAFDEKLFITRSGDAGQTPRAASPLEAPVCRTEAVNALNNAVRYEPDSEASTRSGSTRSRDAGANWGRDSTGRSPPVSPRPTYRVDWLPDGRRFAA